MRCANAFYIAQSGRPGPVLVDVPKDITMMEWDYEPQKPREIAHKNAFGKDEIAAAVRAVNESKKPFIVAGGGVIAAGAGKELRELAGKLNAPVTMTLMGLGAFPASERALSTGMIGMHGTKTSALCTSHCDLLIAVGARFSERVTSDRTQFAKQAKVLHIDVDPAEINKNIRADHEVMGNAKDVLKAMLPGIKRKESGEWMEQIRHWKRSYPLDRATRNARFPKKVLQAMQEEAPGNCVYDGGRAAPDVVRAVPAYRASPPVHFFGRSRHDGVRHGRGDRRGGRYRKAGRQYRGRRQLPHEPAGDRNSSRA